MALADYVCGREGIATCNMNITNALKLCRTARGMTQKELAEKADMSPSYVSLIEKGKRDVSIATLETLANAMNIPVEIILFMGADQSKLSRISPALADELSMSILEELSSAGSPKQEKAQAAEAT